ncbi:DgyrCDS7875 [Dimorphilus gyrociliatus]|uniref:RNA-binding motif protein, X-linked 2 n=1 Tax=Dimorphilus gyrociliatus TaxID=2664684 RepID=A0A7I8VSF1_9ANNE|nr:DgyrCDS7875 [Dimorphilus gyrociliatus]
MNPLTNVKNLNKINKIELEAGIAGTSGSWHKKYKDSAWIFIGGLPYELTEGDALCVFSQYGEIVNINLIRDRKTGKMKGFGFLCYEDQRSTILAVDNLNGIKICGRTIRVDHVEEYKVKLHDDVDETTKQVIMEGCAPVAVIPSDDERKKKSKKKKKKSKKSKKKAKKAESSDDSATTDSEFESKADVKANIKRENSKWDERPVKQERDAESRRNSKWDKRQTEEFESERTFKQERESHSNRRGTGDRREHYNSRDIRRSRSRSGERRYDGKQRFPKREQRSRSRSPGIRRNRDEYREKNDSSTSKLRHDRNFQSRKSRSRSAERGRNNNDKNSRRDRRVKSRSHDRQTRRTRSRSRSPRRYKR